MAQGFLQTSNASEQLENIGSRYFNELIKRSLLEGVVEGYEYDCEVTQCKMHDLIHDLACSVAGKECSIITTTPKNFSEQVRHLSVFGSQLLKNQPSKEEVPLSEILAKAKKLRTLFFPFLVEKKCVTVINLLSSLKYSRILHLSESEFDGLPRSVGDLLHLRYLDLSKNHCIKKLPSSICKLQNLQKLKLFGCTQLNTLPKDTWKISSLRHLELTSQQAFLPNKGIEGLTSLRSLSFHSCGGLLSLVEGMQYLTTLQTLRLCDCQRLSSLKFSLNSLISIETLEIRNCLDLDDLGEEQKVKEEDGLKRHNRLRLLPIRCGNYAKADLKDKRKRKDKGEEKESERGLEKLRSLIIVQLPKLLKLPEGLQNATSLQYLSISNCSRLSSLPEGMRCLTAIQTLRLCDCPRIALLTFSLNSLISLENLEIQNCLDLDFMENRGLQVEDDDSHQGLQKLRLLIISQLPKLVVLPKVHKNVATSLQCLSISDCNRLSSLPQGCTSLTTLQTLRLCNCPRLTSLTFSLNSLISLEIFEIPNCFDLALKDEDGQQGLMKLRTLIIAGLPKLDKLPKVFRNSAANLQYLSITDCDNLSSLPKGMEHLITLQKLRLCNCPGLVSLPFSFNSFISLETLEIRSCSNLALKAEEGQQGLMKLRTLIIAGLHKLDELPTVFRNSAADLQHASISYCKGLVGKLQITARARDYKLSYTPI